MCWRKRKIVPDITQHITQNPETPDDETTSTEDSHKIENENTYIDIENDLKFEILRNDTDRVKYLLELDVIIPLRIMKSLMLYTRSFGMEEILCNYMLLHYS